MLILPFSPSLSDLSSNHLSTLHKDSFRGLTHLTLLDLSKNHLDFLPNDLLLDLDSLSNLWVFVTNNIAKSIEKSSLYSFSLFLARCRRLQENKLESLDAQLFLKLRSLKILDISQNQLLSSLPLELFQSIYHIRGERVDLLQSNFALCCPRIFTTSPLRCIRTKPLSHVSLPHFASIRVQLIVHKVINIAHNKLSRMPNLQEQTELEELDLSKNEFHVLSSDDFKYLKKLKTLRLSENFISK